MLIQQQVSADEKIMEKNMIVLQNDMKSLAYKTVPFKETALKISGGSLTVYNSLSNPSSSTLTIISYDNLMNPTTRVNSFQPGELRYESVKSQTDISLENGAVILRPLNDKGSTMLSEPRWFYDANTNTMVINLINITSNNIMAKEGIGTVQMTLGETIYINVPNVYSIDITYTPKSGLGGRDYSVAWDNYIMKTFSNQPGLSPYQTGSLPGSGFPLKYRLDNPSSFTLVIKKYEVQIKNI
jgi:hypothetical protein